MLNCMRGCIRRRAPLWAIAALIGVLIAIVPVLIVGGPITGALIAAGGWVAVMFLGLLLDCSRVCRRG